MTPRFLQFLLASVLCVTLAPVAYAKGHGGGGNKPDKHGDHDRDRHVDRDHDRDHDRDSHSDKAENRPAGWDKGKKKGWGDCDVPPGQVKKLGCHPNSHRHVVHQRDRDRDHDRDHHTSTVRHTTTTTNRTGRTTTTTTTKVPAQDQPRRTGGKVFNDDGSWRYGSGETTTATKK